MTKMLDINNISRRKLLLAAAIAAPAAVLVASSAEAAKVSQASVQYRGTPNAGHSCGGCKLFTAPSACQVVSGKVSPAGWCQLWQPKA